MKQKSRSREVAVRELPREGSRGSIFIEYLTTTVFVTIIGAGAVLAVGVPLAQLYLFQQMMIVLPVP